MDKQRLSRLKSLNKEAEILQKQIRELEFKPKEYLSDTVKDYRSGYPVTITIDGYGSEEYIKAKDRLYKRLVRKLIAIQREREELESFFDSVDDPEMRVILRLRYVNGLTQEQIAEEMGYSRSAVAMKLERVFIKNK